jgi:hypothetical protein
MASPKRKRQPSTIDKLPEALRDQLARLRREGRSISEIHDHLEKLGAGVSRSAVGRHVKSMAEVGEDMRRSAEMARFIVDQFGEETDERVGRANMALLQGAILELITERPVDEETGEVARLDAGEMKALSLSLQRLISSQRVDADRQIKLRQEFERSASQKLDAAAQTGEVDPDAVAKAKRIMGFEDAA